jgi:dihydropteroate synthase
VAHCAVGKGHATIIADADFLNGEPQALDLLIAELARLESR